MLLTDIVVRNLTKPGRYTDDQTKGLHLWVKANGRRYWIRRFSMEGKRHGQCLGAYPEVSLKQAREKAIEVQNLVNKGINPIAQRTRSKMQAAMPAIPKFRDFALEHIETMCPKWRNAKHADQWINTVCSYASPVIGNLLQYLRSA